jgi:hypothetical protein
MGFKIKSIFGGGSSASDQPAEASANTQTEESTSHVQVTSEQETSVDNQTDVQAQTNVEDVPTAEVKEQAPVAQSPESASEDEEPKKPVAPRRKPRSQEELLLEAVPERANSAPTHLKTILQGKVLIEILPSSKKYLFDGSADKPCSVTEVASAVEADCTISIHGKDLMRISDGDLNPQILMLSHKSKVWGNSKLATYFFNLVAPYSSNY